LSGGIDLHIRLADDRCVERERRAESTSGREPEVAAAKLEDELRVAVGHERRLN
jgi:hypothetical protein